MKETCGSLPSYLLSPICMKTWLTGWKEWILPRDLTPILMKVTTWHKPVKDKNLLLAERPKPDDCRAPSLSASAHSLFSSSLASLLSPSPSSVIGCPNQPSWVPTASPLADPGPPATCLAMGSSLPPPTWPKPTTILLLWRLLSWTAWSGYTLPTH